MAYQPKSYKKFVATAATATLVASAVVPVAFADYASTAAFTDVSASYKVAVDYVVSENIAKGLTETQFGVSTTIKRGDAAIMLANALGINDEKAPASGFSDVPTRGVLAINSLKAKGIVSGKSATNFGFNENITRGEVALLMANVNAYNLKGDVANVKFTDVNARYLAAVAGLVEGKITNGKTATNFGTDNLITRGEFAVFVYKAENPTSSVTSVSSVISLDAKTIQVTFNNPVDAKTLKTDAKVDVVTLLAANNKAVDPGTVTQVLSADGKTLTLTAASYFKGDYTLKVPFEIVKDTNGKFVTAVNKEVTVNDTTAPVLQSATAKVADTKNKINSVTLTFDEVLKVIDTVKINGQNYTPVISGKTATIAVDLDASKSYDVTVVNATDVVDNVKDLQTVALSVAIDNVAPTVTTVTADGENTLVLTVDEALASDLTSTTLTGKVGTFTANVVTGVIKNPENAKEYFVTLNPAYLFKSGNSDTVTLTVAKDALKDALNNKNASEIVKTVSVSKDVTAPVVTNVATTSTEGKVTGFTVTFTEEVTIADTNKISVVNSKGEIINFSDVASTPTVDAKDAKKVNFTLKTTTPQDKYNFDILKGFAKDLALSTNENAAYSFTVDTSSSTAPIATTFTIVGADAVSNVITVNFGTKVKATGTGSALNPASYQLNGTTLPANTEIKFDTSTGTLDQSKVVITLPAGSVAADDSKAIFRVTGVQSLDNKTNASFLDLVPVTDNLAPEAKSFAATDLTKVTVTYSENIVVSADITDEIQLVNASGVAVPFTGYTFADNKLVLTVADSSAIVNVKTTKPTTANILDVKNNAQKTGIVLTK